MFFKKGISVLLAFFLLVSSGGWSLNIHYCRGEMVFISSFYNKNSGCCENDIKKEVCCAVNTELESNNCCSNSILQLELEDVVVEYFKSATFSNLSSHDFLCTFFAFEYSISLIDQLHFYFDSNAPPLYLLYSQLVLYA